MTTEERLAKLEARMAKVEEVVERAEAMFATFMAGPGQRLLKKMLGA